MNANDVVHSYSVEQLEKLGVEVHLDSQELTFRFPVSKEVSTAVEVVHETLSEAGLPNILVEELVDNMAVRIDQHVLSDVLTKTRNPFSMTAMRKVDKNEW